jgi:hypothetical protein
VQEDATSAIAMQLANSDIQSAVAWAQKLPPGTSRQNAMTNIISQWSDVDPTAAAEYALRTAEPEARKAMLENVSRQWARNDPQAALRWAGSLTERGARDSVLPGIVAVVAESDPQQAARLVAQMSRAKRRATQRRRLCGNGRATIRRRRANGSQRSPKGAPANARVENLINRWAQNDPYAVGAWLGALPARRVARRCGECLHPACRFHPIRRQRRSGRRRSATKACATARLNRSQRRG